MGRNGFSGLGYVDNQKEEGGERASGETKSEEEEILLPEWVHESNFLVEKHFTKLHDFLNS